MDAFSERLLVVSSNCASTSGSRRTSCISVESSSNATHAIWNRFRGVTHLLARRTGPRWIASKASAGTDLGPSWSKMLCMCITTCLSSKIRAENEHAKTRMWLPVEYEVKTKPETGTELSSDDK